MIRISGFAAIYGSPDNDGDVVDPRAFDLALAEWGKDRPPFYWQHNPALLIGGIGDMQSTSKGLFVQAIVNDPRYAGLIRKCDGIALSFGYRARTYSTIPGGRILLNVELLEISVVTHPLHPMATILTIEELQLARAAPGGIY